MSRLRIKIRNFGPVLLLVFVSLGFSWKFFLQGLVPLPADVIVGVYYPWRDYIWGNYLTGVPFKNSLLSDVVSIIYPWRIYGVGLLKQGIIPLWIPHALGGAPLLANFQSGLFSPLNLLFFVFPKIEAWSIYILLQPFLASVFCYLYLKNLKLGELASLAGGIIFAFSGFMMVWFEYGIVGHTSVWLPLLLLTVDKLRAKSFVRWLIAGCFFIALSVFSGYPQITIYSLIVFLLYAIYRFLQFKQARYLFSFLVVVLGLLLSSVQLIPGLELLSQSIRQSDPTSAAFSFGILPFQNLVLLLSPDFFGNPVTGNWWGQPVYNETALYVGIFGLMFALFGILSSFKNKSPSLFFKVIFLLSLLFAFDTPIAHLAKSFNVPGLSAASSGRYLFLVDFSLAMLAALGIESFFERNNKLKFFLLFTGIASIFIFLWMFVLFPGKFFTEASWVSNLTVSKRNLVLPTVLFLFMILVGIANFVLPAKYRRLNFLFKFIILFAIILDLFRFGWKYNPFTPKEFLYPQTQLTRYLQKNAGIDRFVGMISQSMWIHYDLLSPEGYDAMMLKRYNEFAGRINEDKFSRISTGSRWVGVSNNNSPLLDLLGVKYLLFFDPEANGKQEFLSSGFPQEKYNLVFQHGHSKVYERKSSLPRAFIVHGVKIAKDEEILRTIMDKNFDPRQAVLLEKTPRSSSEEKVGEDEVLVDKNSYFENKVQLTTHSSSNGFLFLSDNFYPGWQAFLDGNKVEIYRADYTFRAVFLPKGEHKMSFIYSPESFRIGLIVSLLTLVSLIFTALWSLLKGRRWLFLSQ